MSMKWKYILVYLCVQYLMDGFEESPVQVCESSGHVPGVDT